MNRAVVIILAIIVGGGVGGVLGFAVPFIWAQIQPEAEQALSFFPIISVPIGVVICALIGMILAIVKTQKTED